MLGWARRWDIEGVVEGERLIFLLLICTIAAFCCCKTVVVLVKADLGTRSQRPIA